MEELKENIRKNWNDYDVDNDIDKYIASILAIIVVEDLDKKIFTYELKSEKITKTLDIAIFSSVLNKTGKNDENLKYFFHSIYFYF